MMISIRLSIFVMMLVAIHLNSNIKNKELHSRILTLLLFTYFLHNALLIPILIISPVKLVYIYLAVPFGLMYGPLMFFYYISLRKRKMSKGIITLNLIPIFIAWIAYFIFVLNEHVRIQTQMYYYPILYGCIGISLLIYSIYAYIFDSNNKDHFILFFYFILAGIFSIYISFELIIKNIDLIHSLEIVTSLTITLILALGGLLLLNLVYQLFINQFQPKLANKQNSPYVINTDAPIKDKSYKALSPSTNHISEYSNASKIKSDQKLIDDFFISDHIIDTTMSLSKAANILDISQNKLEKLIQHNHGVTFNKILTIKRIEYASKIIIENKTSEIPDNLYALCGFNSISTFYRNFNTIMGCSPSQFKTQNDLS